MSGKRNVSVCRGHQLANALYVPSRLRLKSSYRVKRKSIFLGCVKRGFVLVRCYTLKPMAATHLLDLVQGPAECVDWLILAGQQIVLRAQHIRIHY